MFANLCEMALVAHIRLTWRTIGEEAPSRAKKEASSFREVKYARNCAFFSEEREKTGVQKLVETEPRSAALSVI